MFGEYYADREMEGVHHDAAYFLSIPNLRRWAVNALEEDNHELTQEEIDEMDIDEEENTATMHFDSTPRNEGWGMTEIPRRKPETMEEPEEEEEETWHYCHGKRCCDDRSKAPFQGCTYCRSSRCCKGQSKMLPDIDEAVSIVQLGQLDLTVNLRMTATVRGEGNFHDQKLRVQSIIKKLFNEDFPGVDVQLLPASSEKPNKPGEHNKELVDCTAQLSPKETKRQVGTSQTEVEVKITKKAEQQNGIKNSPQPEVRVTKRIQQQEIEQQEAEQQKGTKDIPQPEANVVKETEKQEDILQSEVNITEELKQIGSAITEEYNQQEESKNQEKVEQPEETPEPEVESKTTDETEPHEDTTEEFEHQEPEVKLVQEIEQNTTPEAEVESGDTNQTVQQEETTQFELDTTNETEQQEETPEPEVMITKEIEQQEERVEVPKETNIVEQTDKDAEQEEASEPEAEITKETVLSEDDSAPEPEVETEITQEAELLQGAPKPEVEMHMETLQPELKITKEMGQQQDTLEPEAETTEETVQKEETPEPEVETTKVAEQQESGLEITKFEELEQKDGTPVTGVEVLGEAEKEVTSGGEVGTTKQHKQKLEETTETKVGITEIPANELDSVNFGLENLFGLFDGLNLRKRLFKKHTTSETEAKTIKQLEQQKAEQEELLESVKVPEKPEQQIETEVNPTVEALGENQVRTPINRA